MEEPYCTADSKNHIDITKEEVEMCVSNIIAMNKAGRCHIAYNDNRGENNRLIKDYYFDSSMRKLLIGNITVEDFCYGLKNSKKEFEDEILYVFHKSLKLQRKCSEEETETVHLYIKVNVLDDYCIIISLHKEKYPLIPKYGNR